MVDVLSSESREAGVASLRPGVVDMFVTALRGEHMRPGDDGYETARRVWNGMVDKRPGLIVRAAGVSDVLRTIDFARSNDVTLAVRSGGHNVSGNAVCERGVVLDLSRMRSVRAHPASRTVRAEPGVTWGEFDREAQEFGLGCTGGVVSTTGITGLTLGGGVGWLVRKHGLACDNLLSVDVVTAEGELLTASQDENSELFWGMRGAGANLGVVTSLRYQVHPLGQVFGGLVLHPHDRARDVFEFYREFAPTAPEELTTYCGLLTSPDGAPVVGLVACYSGPSGLAEQALAPVRSFGAPLVDLFQPMPYTAMQTLLDGAFPAGLRYYWKSDFLRELSDDAIDVLVDGSANKTSPLSAVMVEWYGGAASRVPEDGTAFPHRAPQYNVVISASWEDETEDAGHVEWAQRLWKEMQPFSSGRVYVNALGAEGDDRVKQAFGANYGRLAALKAKYDPDNFFRMNQNVAPEP